MGSDLTSFLTANSSKNYLSMQLIPQFAKNIAELEDSGDKNQVYVLPDGYIYAWMVKTETSTGVAYTNILDTATKTLNARWNSSNALDTTVGKGTGHVALDYIDVKSGDVLRFKAPGGATDAGANGHSKLLAGGYSRVRYYNASNTLVASNSDAKPHMDFKVTTDSEGVSSIVVGYKNTTAGDDSTNALSSQAGSIAKARIAIYLSSAAVTEADLEGAVITINEEIKEGTTETTTEGWFSTGHAFVPADYEDRIIGLEEDVSALKKTATASRSSLLDGMSVFAPSPQLPADGSQGSDFNADPLVIDCDQIYDYIAPLLTKYPRYITKETMGKDSSGTYDWNRYICCRRFYDAWRLRDRTVMYAWVSGDITVYAASVSPRRGDTVYTTPYIGEAYATVTEVDNANQTRTINGLTFTRDPAQDVKPELIFTRSDYDPRLKFAYPGILRRVYSSNGVWIHTIRDDGYTDDVTRPPDMSCHGNTLTDSDGSVYVRYPLGDRDKNFKKFPVIVLGANEHGTEGDPAIPAIIKARMIKDLCETTNAQNPFLNLLKNNYMVVFCPIINPWGFANAKQFNSNNVNIDRNFDTPGWGLDPNTQTVHGAYGGSEIETQYFMNTLVESGATIALANHALGNSIDTSIGESPSSGLCHYMFGRNKDKWKEDLGKIAMTMSANYNLSFTDYGQAPPESWAKTRSYMDWIGIEGGAIEMQSREGFVSAGEGAPYTARVMEGAYTQMLQVLCMLMDKNSNSV